MFTKLTTKVAAIGLLLALQVPAALAVSDPTISGTTGTGMAGSSVHSSMSVAFAPDNSFSARSVAAWDFHLNWGAAPLTLDTANSKISIAGLPTTLDNFAGTLPSTLTATSGSGFYSFSWLDDVNFFATLDLSTGITLDAVFNIDAGAAAGTYDIGFATNGGASPSSFTDDSYNSFSYSAVTAGQHPMQVVVYPTAGPGPSLPPVVSAVPEPETLLLMGSGVLGVLVVTQRRRRVLAKRSV